MNIESMGADKSREAQGYTLVSHVADIQVHAWAGSRQALLNEVVTSLGEIAGFRRTEGEPDRVKTRFHIAHADESVILVDLISEIIAWMYIEFVIPDTVRILYWNERGLEVECEGFAVEAFEKEIKAVTFHDAIFRKKSDGNWECKLIFDI